MPANQEGKEKMMGYSTNQEFATEFHQSINPAQAEFDRLVARRLITSMDTQRIVLPFFEKSTIEFN